MSNDIKSCVVCAWREQCRKKFFITSSAGQFNCPDFSYDISLKKGDKSKNKPKNKD